MERKIGETFELKEKRMQHVWVKAVINVLL